MMLTWTSQQQRSCLYLVVGLLWLTILLPTIALTYPWSRRCSHQYYYYYYRSTTRTTTQLYNNNNWIGDDRNKDWDFSDFWNAFTNNDNSNKKKKIRPETDDNDEDDEDEELSLRRERPKRERRPTPPPRRRGVRPPPPTAMRRTRSDQRDSTTRDDEEEEEYQQQKQFEKEEYDQQQQQQEERDEEVKQQKKLVERYQTRCQLLEHVVSDVRKNNTILSNRVQILQNALKEQTLSNQEYQRKWNATEARLKLEYEQDCTQLMDLLDQEKELRTKLKNDYQLLQQEFTTSQEQVKEQKQLLVQMKKEQDEEADDDNEEILLLSQQINRWKVKWEKEEKRRLQETSMMKNSTDATISILKDKLAQLQSELKEIEKKFHVREEIYKRTILSSKDKTLTIQKKLDNLTQEREDLSQLVNKLQAELSEETVKRGELEEMVNAMISKENSELLMNSTISEKTNHTDTEMGMSNKTIHKDDDTKAVKKELESMKQKYEESIQLADASAKAAEERDQTMEELETLKKQYEASMKIAEASVKAAEEREERWKKEVEVLQGKVDKLMTDKDQLNDIKSLLEEKVELQEESFAEKLNEANQKRDDVVRKLQTENQNLIKSFEEEREKLMMEFASSKEEWNMKMNEILRKHDQDLVRLKADSMKSPQTTIEEYKTKFDNVGIALDFIPPTDQEVEEDEKKKGKWRRFFGRMKKRFKRPPP